MQIICVIGPFLPIPPVKGGAVERIFLSLCEEFAKRGHEVTIISRRYGDLANSECVNDVGHIRIKSYNAPKNKVLYRIFDVLYSIRVCLIMPEADITITNSVFLPLIIPKSRAGKIYVSVARFPKGQMGLYRRATRLQAVSSAVASAIVQQTPSLAPLVKTIPNCLGLSFCDLCPPTQAERASVILYVGRIAREKGIHLLIQAFVKLMETPKFDWRLVIIGPHLESEGGDGKEYLDQLKAISLPIATSIDFVSPIFDEKELIKQYFKSSIFCYPSIAEYGESFGLAPLEAMACGCAVITSSLQCFEDFTLPGKNTLKFDHKVLPVENLLRALIELTNSPEMRARIAAVAIETARKFTPSNIADAFIEDFNEILR